MLHVDVPLAFDARTLNARGIPVSDYEVWNVANDRRTVKASPRVTDKSVAMQESWFSQIEKWNKMVQAGEGAAVARELSQRSHRDLPTELLAKVARRTTCSSVNNW